MSPRAFAAAALALAVACSSTDAPNAAPGPSTVVPVARGGDWMARFDKQLGVAHAGGHRVAFVGDSITEAWPGAGKETWQQVWVPRHAICLGISGDRTQHVLWRLDHGLADALASDRNDVRACVVMIGTNNSNGDDNTAAEIATGIVRVVRRLCSALPNAKVLLLAIFPRGERPDAQRDKCQQASELAFEALAGDSRVVCRDIGARFLGEGGTLSEAMMPDRLHLSAAAYRVWADAIVDDVDAMLK